MKSKFGYFTYFVLFLSLAFSIIVVMVLSGNALSKDMPWGFFLFFSSFFVFTWVWLIFGELRLKAISLVINKDSILVRRFIGLGKARTYYLNEIEGYKTSILTSNAGRYEYLYLIVHDKKIAKISEYNHSNYLDLKRTIVAHNIKNLGFEQFGYIKEIREIFE